MEIYERDIAGLYYTERQRQRVREKDYSKREVWKKNIQAGEK